MPHKADAGSIVLSLLVSRGTSSQGSTEQFMRTSAGIWRFKTVTLAVTQSFLNLVREAERGRGLVEGIGGRCTTCAFLRFFETLVAWMGQRKITKSQQGCCVVEACKSAPGAGQTWCAKRLQPLVVGAQLLTDHTLPNAHLRNRSQHGKRQRGRICLDVG